jgi:ubiquinol-cytochrome c reductase cytochrome b/c1 subunit
MLMVQIVTGIVLAMHYTPHADMAFDSVEHIMRDVNYGWLMRYLHANGASMFFIAVYIHIFRGIYYGSYKAPREVLVDHRRADLLTMMATAFMGYVLPWGQMSFWAPRSSPTCSPPSRSSAIRSSRAVGRLFGRQPDAAALLLAALPAALRARRAGGAAHLGAARAGQQQPGRRRVKSGAGHAAVPPLLHHEGRLRGDGVPDVFAVFVFFAPNYMGHAINYEEANPLVTPAHIVPEWYFLPYYAILRAVPDKLGGVVLMFGSILVLFALPWLDTSKVRSATTGRCSRASSGSSPCLRGARAISAPKPAEGAYVVFSQILTIYYFAHFLVILPLLGLLESPKPLPSSISDDVLAKKVDLPGCCACRVIWGKHDDNAQDTRDRRRRPRALHRGGAGSAGRPEAGKGRELLLRGPVRHLRPGQLQRGYKVYKEVCAACHSMQLVSFRNLSAAGRAGVHRSR